MLGLSRFRFCALYRKAKAAPSAEIEMNLADLGATRSEARSGRKGYESGCPGAASDIVPM
jgi:hypothetical protein